MKTLLKLLGGFALGTLAFAPSARAAAPSVTTSNPTGITTNSAVLRGTANPNGLATFAYFEWGVATNYDQATASQALGSGTGTLAFSAPLTGLTPQTMYHCRAVVYSAGVTNRGADVAFSTKPTPTNLVVTNLITDDVRGAIERGGTVTFATDGVLLLNSPIEIANDVCLDASNHAITLSGGTTSRIFTVRPGTLLCLSNLTLADGRSTNGGAIHNEGTVLASGCRFTNNLAIGASGVNGTNGAEGSDSANPALVTAGSPGQEGGAGQEAAGGAIFTSGAANLVGCVFHDNRALAGNGGKGGNGGGGGTYTGSGGGGKDGANGGMAGRAGAASGGSIANHGLLEVSGCVFSNSFAVGGGGGGGGTGGRQGYVTGIGASPTPTNGVSTTGAVGGISRGGAIYSSGSTHLSNCRFFANGSWGGKGGTGAVYYGNQINGGPGDPAPAGPGGMSYGGALDAETNAVVLDCTFSFNQSVAGKGGVPGTRILFTGFTVGVDGANGGSALGGAFSVAQGARVARSLCVGNVAVGGAGEASEPGFRPSDGGRAAGGAASAGTNCAFVNCTFAGNEAVGGLAGIANSPFPPGFTYNARRGNGGDAVGGAIFGEGNNSGTNLTIAANTARPGGYPDFTNQNVLVSWNGTNGNSHGGSIASTGGVFQLVNSILSGGTSNNVWGVVADLGHNLSTDATPAWTSGTSLSNTDPLLLPLANNGGPTLTLALRAGSPALNAADCASTSLTDQRGVARPDGPGCDIGAYEGAGVFTLAIWRESAATNVVRHLAEPGRAYRLEKTSSFNGWTPVVTNTAPPVGVLDFRIAAPGAPCFYRVLAQ